MPSTQTKFVSGDAGAKGKFIFAQKKMAGEPILVENVLDFSSTGPGSVGAGDTVQALKIPANTLVAKVGVTVITAEGGTCTADVGDGTDPNGWNDAIDLNAAAGTSAYSLVGTDAYASGKIYTEDDTIDLTMDDAAATGKIVVWALTWPLGTDVA